MWTRAELKTKAKAVLRGSYWKALAVSVIMALAGGSEMSPKTTWKWNERDQAFFQQSFTNFEPEKALFWVAIIIGTVLVFALVVTLIRMFIGYQLEVGCRRYFLSSAQGEVDFNLLGYGFKKHRYMDILKAMLWRSMFNFLWYLLFIIPGVVKYYEYKMVPYILAENPHIGYRRALDLSKDMTRGQKMDMFVLDLSFLGWYILGLLLLTVGTIFVMPYDNATKAELYLVLRQNALDHGYCTADELAVELEAKEVF